MNVFLFCLRWTLFLLLLGGTCSVLQRTLRLKPCFSPVVTLCSMASVVYWGGLLGYLRPVTYAVLFLTILCTGYEINYRKNNPFVWTELPVIAGCFLIAALSFGLILFQDSLVHYDNFTHWGLVVKEMLITHAFPTAESTLIEFTNYPTGTASLIYFVCTAVGHGENSMIMAQALLIFSALYAVFGIIEERGRFLLTVTLGAGLSLLSIFNLAIRINNLLVDFLLPVLALAAIALIYRHRREPEVLLPAIVPLLGLLVVVKSSGIIFASVALLYLVYTLVKYALPICPKRLVLLGKALLAIGLCLLPLIAWNLHTDAVFAGVSNKFETDLTVVTAGFGGKTEEEIFQICRLFLSTITDITQRSTVGILLFQVLAIVACCIGCIVLKKRWALPKVLLAMDVVLIAYLLGILAMYIFSMPMEEAIYLAAFDRYSSSIVVLFGGVLTMCLTIDMENSFFYRLGEVDDVHSFKTIESKSLYLKSSVACVIVIALVLTSEFNGMLYQENLNRHSISHVVKDVAGDNWSTEVSDARYLVLANDTDGLVTNYYLHYVAQYYLRAHHVDTICLFYEDNFLNLLSQYDYLVIVETSSQAQYLMEKYFNLDGHAGIYDLSPLH